MTNHVIEDIFDTKEVTENIRKFCEKLNQTGDESLQCASRLYQENFKRTYDWYQNELNKYNNQNIGAIINALQTVNTTICLNIIHSNMFENDIETKKQLIEMLLSKQKDLIEKFDGVYKLMKAQPQTNTKQ